MKATRNLEPLLSQVAKTITGRRVRVEIKKTPIAGTVGMAVAWRDGSFTIILDPKTGLDEVYKTLLHECGHVILGHVKPASKPDKGGIDPETIFIAMVKAGSLPAQAVNQKDDQEAACDMVADILDQWAALRVGQGGALEDYPISLQKLIAFLEVKL